METVRTCGWADAAGARSVGGMELVVAFVSALIGLSAAFFLSIGVYDLVPDAWLRVGRWRQRALFGSWSVSRNPMIPRSIRHTPLD